jgi:hypothetical protein
VIKVVAVLRRQPALEAAAFQDYWLNVHGPHVLVA